MLGVARVDGTPGKIGRHSVALLGIPRVFSPHLRFCCQLSTELDSVNKGHAAMYVDIRS
jgi:hypothetical protein